MLKNDESLVAVGKRLTVLRVMAGLNRDQLSAQAGVSITSISYWEHGSGAPMSVRSIGKVISAIEKAGVKCSEEWLKTGNGAQPILFNQVKKLPTKNIQVNFELDSSPFIEEINLFLSTCKNPENAAIIKMENNALSPVFEKGDIIGGLFLSADSVDLSKEKACIIKLENKLDVRRIRRNPIASSFNLSYFSYDSQCDSPFEINDIHLTFIAPILRLWR